MEKFYTVKPESEPWKQYWKYENQSKEFTKFFSEFADANGITSSKVVMSNSRLWIIPDEHDRAVFADQFTVSKPGIFKMKSPIGKKWMQFVKGNKVPNPHKPFVSFWFNNYHGKSYSRLFDLKDVLYCTFQSEGDFTANEDLVEIKASEFFKIMEENGISL